MHRLYMAIHRLDCRLTTAKRAAKYTAENMLLYPLKIKNNLLGHESHV